jgi:hypothetical protein
MKRMIDGDFLQLAWSSYSISKIDLLLIKMKTLTKFHQKQEWSKPVEDCANFSFNVYVVAF